MFSLLSRGFKRKSPLFESTNHRTVPKTFSITGRPNTDFKLYNSSKLSKLQSLITKNVKTAGLSLSDNIKQFAKTDKEFNDFLKKFKHQSEPSTANYLDSTEPVDASKYIKDQRRTEADRLDELYLLDQFRKKKIADDLADLEKKAKFSHEFNEDELESDGKEIADKSLNTKRDIKAAQLGERVYYNEEFFHTMVIDAGSTTNVTKLARVNKRWVLLYMGGNNGIISYGRGTGLNYQDAYEKAVLELKRNLICINIDSLMSFTGYVEGHFNDTAIELHRNVGPHFGNPVFYDIVAMAGLKNFSIRLRSRNVNYHAIIYCFFQCLIKCETPRMIAEKTGQKFYEITYGRTWKDSMPMSWGIE